MPTKPKIRLLVADDREMVRRGARALLAGTEIEVVAEAATSQAAVRLALGKDVDRYHRHQAAAGDLPELRLRKVLLPRDLPASDGLPIGAEKSRKLADSAGRWALPHGHNQHDHGSEVDLPAEEPHRRRPRSLAATLPIAARTRRGLFETGRIGKRGQALALQKSSPRSPNTRQNNRVQRQMGSKRA
jgi:CheY-like chemotaxis protein